MSAIDTAALDETVRRFPTMLREFRDAAAGTIEPRMADAIVREYRLVLAERSKVRGA